MIALFYILVISLGVLTLIARLLPREQAYLISKREYAAAIYLPVVASFSPHYAVFGGLVIAFMAFIPATREERLRLFFFSLHLLPALSYTITVPLQLITINYYVLLALGCLSVVLSARPNLVARLRPWDVLVVLLIGGLVLAGVKDTSLTNGMRVVVGFTIALGVPYLLVSRGTALTRSPTDLLLAVALGATVVATITIFESQRNWLLYDNFSHRFGITETNSAYAKQRAGYLRASTTFPESTSLSLFLSMATIMLVALRSKFARPAVFWVMLGILLVAQVSTFARVGLLATAVGLLALLWHHRRYGLVIFTALAAPLLYTLLKLASESVPVLRAMFGETGEGASTIDYRSRLATRMYEEILREPLFGLTPSQIQIRLDDMRQGEGIIDLVNAPLMIALQSGVVGLVAFLVPSIALIVWMVRMRRLKTSDELTAIRAVFACMIAFHAALITTSFSGSHRMWMMVLIGLGAGLHAAHRSAVARQRRAEPYLGPEPAASAAE